MDVKVWTDMFALGLPLVEKVLRPIIVYLFLVVGLRLAGKRELAQLNPFDLVVLLTLSNTVQNAIIGDDTSVTGGLIGAATLLVVNAAVVRFVFAHPSLERVVEGVPTVLIDGGQIQEANLRRELITRYELEIDANRHGFDSLDEVDRAVLEANGTISFAARKPSPEVRRHEEVLRRLDELGREVTALRASVGARG
jgi:uncharacterized membrane protein YcaP (DUF421 family)